MKLLRCALAISCAALLAACSDNHAAAPTPARLSATVTPNPMAAPTEGGSDLLFNLELRAGRSGTVSLQEGDAQLLDASGALVGRTKNFWSQESGCAICPPQVRLDAGSSATYSGHRVRYIGGGKPARFIYALSFVDDYGSGSVTIEVPVR